MVPAAQQTHVIFPIQNMSLAVSKLLDIVLCCVLSSRQKTLTEKTSLVTALFVYLFIYFFLSID